MQAYADELWVFRCQVVDEFLCDDMPGGEYALGATEILHGEIIEIDHRISFCP